MEITERDILTNLPYAPGAHLVFDHHHSETLRNERRPAEPHHRPRRAVGRPGHLRPLRRRRALPGGLRRADAAPSTRPTRRDYALDDILDPQGWTLLNFLMDSRTGLGRFREFRISNYQLMMLLIDACIAAQTVDEILALPDVAERADLFRGLLGAVRRAAAPGQPPGRRRGRGRPARRGDHPRGQPLHGLRAVPRGPGLGAHHLGPAEAEHGLRLRQVDPRPHLAGRHRRGDAAVRRRRPPGRRHLPGPARGLRPGAGRDHRRPAGPRARSRCDRKSRGAGSRTFPPRRVQVVGLALDPTRRSCSAPHAHQHDTPAPTCAGRLFTPGTASSQAFERGADQLLLLPGLGARRPARSAADAARSDRDHSTGRGQGRHDPAGDGPEARAVVGVRRSAPGRRRVGSPSCRCPSYRSAAPPWVAAPWPGTAGVRVSATGGMAAPLAGSAYVGTTVKLICADRRQRAHRDGQVRGLARGQRLARHRDPGDVRGGLGDRAPPWMPSSGVSSVRLVICGAQSSTDSG